LGLKNRYIPILSVKSTAFAPGIENSDFLSGSAKKARSFGGVNSTCGGSGGTCDAIVGLKLGWMMVGKPESGDICWYAARTFLGFGRVLMVNIVCCVYRDEIDLRLIEVQ
jgi:hypothetical protein